MDKSHTQTMDSSKEKGLYFCVIWTLVRISSATEEGSGQVQTPDLSRKLPRGQGMAGIPRGGLAPTSHPAAVPGGYRDPLATARAAAACAGPVSVGLQRGNAGRAQLRPGKVNIGGTRKHPVVGTSSSRASRDAPQLPAGSGPGREGPGQGRGGPGGGAGACRPRPSRAGVSAGRGAGPPSSSAPIGCRAAGARVLTHRALPLAADAEGAGPALGE